MSNYNRNSNKAGKPVDRNEVPDDNKKTYQGNRKDSRNKRTQGRKEQTTPKGASMDNVHTNDISWWNNSPLYPDATRVPFNRIAGAPVNYGTTLTNGTTILTVTSAAMPGIAVLDVLPTIGDSTGVNSPVNRAFTSLYGDIYSKTTGAMQFQQMDLAMFMTSMSSIASLIAHCKRVLGVSQFYHGQNYYYPEALLTALGVDPDEVIGHQDQLRSQLNNVILSFNGLKVPDILPLYIRQYSLFHSIYADEDSVASQLYLFKPAYYYIYDDTASKCTCTKITNFSMASLLALIESLLNAWRTSSDLGIISGSIQRAFSDKNFMTLDYALMTDVVLPVVDRNIMWQINNADIVTPLVSTFNITQSPTENKIICQGMYDIEIDNDAVQFAFLSMPLKLLRSFDGSSDDEFVMEATRLMQRPQPLAWEEPLMRNGTEVVTALTLFTTELDGSGKVTLVTQKTESSLLVLISSAAATVRQANAKFIASLSKFKYAPPIYVAVGSSATEFKLSPVSGDVYRYTTIDGETLDGLTAAALQSIYATDWQGLKPANPIV